MEAWNFNQIEAQRAFDAALKVDPACSRCWWGIAYALGPGANRFEHAADRAHEPPAHAHRSNGAVQDTVVDKGAVC